MTDSSQTVNGFRLTDGTETTKSEVWRVLAGLGFAVPIDYSGYQFGRYKAIKRPSDPMIRRPKYTSFKRDVSGCFATSVISPIEIQVSVPLQGVDS